MDNNETTTNQSSIDDDWLNQYKADLFAKAATIDSSMLPSDIPVVYAASAVGLPANTLILLTTVYGPVKFNNLFRWTMIVTSIADFLHMLCKVLRILSRVYWNSATGYQILSGIAYFFSLFSDLLALTLTVDRFIGMVFPFFYKNLRPRVKLIAWVITICVCVLIAATRLHYAFVTYHYSSYAFVSSVWFSYLTYFSDTIVPFLLLVFTVVLVFAMVLVLRKRFNEQKRNRWMENNLRERVKEMQKTTSLMMSLLFLCFLNQIGYVFYQVTFMLSQQCDLYEFSNRAQVYSCYVTKSAYFLSARLSMYFENLSKTANFYLYISFNKTFRRSFIALLARCRPVDVTSVSNRS